MAQLPNKEEIIIRHEMGTYLDALRDALEWTKPQIQKAIDTIVNDEGEE